jgi:hypothetical protein
MVDFSMNQPFSIQGWEIGAAIFLSEVDKREKRRILFFAFCTFFFIPKKKKKKF